VPHGPILTELAGHKAVSLSDVSTDYLNHRFDATRWDRLLQSVHSCGKEAALVCSALPGIVKFGITAAKWLPFAMQNSSCIHRDGRPLCPTKLWLFSYF